MSARRSNLPPVVVVLGVVVVVCLGVVAVGVLLTGYGSKLEFNGGELYHTRRVTRAEARRLGEYLAKEGFFDGSHKTVQLDRGGGAYQVRCVVKKGVDTDPVMVEVFRAMAAQLSRDVFGGSRVEVHLCDTNLLTLRVVVPVG